MNKLMLGALLIGLFVACGGEDKKVVVVTPDATVQCNPLLNTGCPANQKCTWLVDAITPNYVGHIGCAPNGTVGVGETCSYGPPGELGYDDCAFGGVCTNFRNSMTNPTGFCKAICDQQGGMPACASTHTCVIYSSLFDLGETTPAAAGVCNLSCNPLEDNDFDGSGTDLTRPGTTCGSAAEGCYGSPSYGTPPISGWSCTRDIHYGGSGTFYGHRTPCIESNGCADPGPKVFQNSCNQGYLPLLIETTGSTTTICVAFCEPANCFMGNCGTNNENIQGKLRSPGGPNHRCNATDRLGSFDSMPDGGEHCQYLWRREIDNNTSTYLPSPTSDTLGFCFDHSKYQYDSNNDNMPDKNLPSCALLADGFSPMGADPADPTTYWHAGDLGCVDSTRLMVNGKVQIPDAAFEKMSKIDMPRPLYDRRMYEPE